MINKSLELAFHFAALGGLAVVALLLNDGQRAGALIGAIVASICIIIIACALNLAKKMTSGKG